MAGATQWRRLKILLSLLFLLLALTARADYLTETVTQVHDGDTITISLTGSAATRGQPRFVRVRLNGIDAPELAQPFGPGVARPSHGCVLRPGQLVSSA
jgi:endonuclease YncB( thermonuclease family)